MRAKCASVGKRAAPPAKEKEGAEARPCFVHRALRGERWGDPPAADESDGGELCCTCVGAEGGEVM